VFWYTLSMLTPEQQNFIDRRSDNNIKVIPFDQKSNEKFEEIKKQVQSILGNLEVLHRGSTGLGIGGQPEIDIYIPVSVQEIPELTAEMEKVWGKPKSIYPDERTKFIRYIGETMIEVILVNKSCKSWIDGEIFFDYLKHNKDAREEYEKLKGIGESLPIREYYRRKFEFMNDILNRVT
jgi:GrpB-like predicted nucleotidyltransferase (UPF0157 family)